MAALLREIQAADMLGYQEMTDFRAAVKSGIVPGPCRQIKAGRRNVNVWSRMEIERWIDNSTTSASAYQTLAADIEAIT